jgi:hypothetical protein
LACSTRPLIDSWATTLRLLAVMAAIALCYLIGRWFAETLRDLAASGTLPTL